MSGSGGVGGGSRAVRVRLRPGPDRPHRQELADPIIRCTVDMYQKISSDLLPTPVKCHYTFNLRDPAKMLQGIMMVNVKLSLNNNKDAARRPARHGAERSEYRAMRCGVSLSPDVCVCVC